MEWEITESGGGDKGGVRLPSIEPCEFVRFNKSLRDAFFLKMGGNPDFRDGLNVPPLLLVPLA